MCVNPELLQVFNLSENGLGSKGFLLTTVTVQRAAGLQSALVEFLRAAAGLLQRTTVEARLKAGHVPEVLGEFSCQLLGSL